MLFWVCAIAFFLFELWAHSFFIAQSCILEWNQGLGRKMYFIHHCSRNVAGSRKNQ